MNRAAIPTVSVIIPCYNRERFIADTVDSVLAQTWPNLEVLVVDDGCTDRSREILESYGGRLTILEHPELKNRGQSVSINLALRRCRGKYVAILDSDDLFMPDKLEKQVRFLEEYLDFGAVYANCVYIDENGRPLCPMYPAGHTPPSGPSDVLLDCCYNVPSNTLCRRSVYEQIGFFDESLRSAQDHDVAIRIAEVTKVGYIDECLWSYRRHGDSISQTRTMERWLNGFRILDAAMKRYPYSSSVVRRRKAVLHFRVAQCSLHDGNYLRALFHLLMSGIYDPFRSMGVIMGKERVSGPQ